MSRDGAERARAMISTMVAGLADDDRVAIYAGSGQDKTQRTLDVGELRDLLRPERSPVSPDPSAAGRFWIVMALDRDGPCERGVTPYRRHAARSTARAEARRLAREHGGRFAVLQAVSVVGWTETEFVAPEGAPDVTPRGRAKQASPPHPHDDASIPF